MLVNKNEKVRLGFLGKLRSGSDDPEKELVQIFNSNLSLINSVLGDYFHFENVSTSDIKESGKALKIESEDTYTDNTDQKYKLVLTMESYYSDSYKGRNNSFIFALMRQNNRSLTKFCYEKINDSVDNMKESVKQVSEKALKRFKAYTESFIKEAEKEEGVIRKVGNKWRILKKNRKDYWPAEYDTKADAEAALRAYWANKKEAKEKEDLIVLEFFDTKAGMDFIKSVGYNLIKIFGHTLYFDHITPNTADLFYKGQEVAEVIYNDNTEEVVIMPEDETIAPVAFYDTSEYEIQDYLSDLILGELNPQYV